MCTFAVLFINCMPEIPEQNIKSELLTSKNHIIIDVRSEGEYAQGRIPGAINIALLNNSERAQVGIIYKNEGTHAAVIKGFELVGGRFHEMIKAVKKEARNKNILVYCWRGGLRSNIVCWMLGTAGLPVTKLKGGYKSYRNFVLKELEINRPLIVLGGKTGSGKSELLKQLAAKKEAIIDLEYLANHKGSVYGGLNGEAQPSNEFFENLLVVELLKIKNNQPIWLEDESRLIGKVKIPDSFYEQMKLAPLVFIEVLEAERENRILQEYAQIDKSKLIEATWRLEKRLGNQNVRLAVDFIENNEFINWIKIVLPYYDRSYMHSFVKKKRKQVFNLVKHKLNAEIFENKLIEMRKKINFKSEN